MVIDWSRAKGWMHSWPDLSGREKSIKPPQLHLLVHRGPGKGKVEALGMSSMKNSVK